MLSLYSVLIIPRVIATPALMVVSVSYSIVGTPYLGTDSHCCQVCIMSRFVVVCTAQIVGSDPTESMEGLTPCVSELGFTMPQECFFSQVFSNVIANTSEQMYNSGWKQSK